MAFNGAWYSGLIRRLSGRQNQAALEELGHRLSDSEEAMTILRFKGYTGSTLAEMVKKVPPVSLRHS